MDNRDMFYNSYGYSTGFPNQMYPQNMMFPNQGNNLSELDNRLNKIEKQISRLNQRILRLESMNNNTYSEPDNNLYML